MAQSPGDATAVAVVSKGVRAKWTWRNRRQLNMGSRHEIQAVGRILYGVLLRPVKDEQRRYAVFVGPVHRFMARIRHWIQLGFDEGAFRMVGDRNALSAQEIPGDLSTGEPL